MKKRTKFTPSKEQKQLTTTEKREVRRRRARRRTIVRALIVVALIAVAVLIWQNWDNLAPDRLIGSFENLFGVGTGSYPIDMSGTHVQRLQQVDNYAAVLTDSHLFYLNHSGAEVSRYSLAYPTALMRTADQYVLVAEQGGRRLHLSTRNKVVLEMEAEADILAVAVNKKGQIAVLTDGPQGYTVQVKVYDKTGKLLYTRDRNHTAVDVALSPDGAQVATLSVDAVNGNLNTTMDVFSLKTSATDALCSYLAKDRLLNHMEYLEGGWLAAFSEDSVVMLDTSDGLATLYVPTDMRVLGYAVAGKDLALAVRPYGDTGGGQIHIVTTEGKATCTMDFIGAFRDLAGHEHQYALLTDTYVQAFSATAEGDTVPVEADGRQVAVSDEQVVVLGLNRLEAYDTAAK